MGFTDQGLGILGLRVGIVGFIGLRDVPGTWPATWSAGSRVSRRRCARSTLGFCQLGGGSGVPGVRFLWLQP